VVGQEQDNKTICNICKKFKIKKFKQFVIGGKTRQLSSFAGVNAANQLSTHFLIHDAARPVLSQKLILNVVNGTINYGACCSAVPAKDTIKFVDENGFAKKTLNRSSLALAQTPQGFEKELYLCAMQKAVKSKNDYTDDAQLIENYGKEVYLCEGSYKNIKVTTKEDIILATIALKKQA
jgi:2-C-methyl-D-erythritol 4-phosphate cytidylyltransferase